MEKRIFALNREGALLIVGGNADRLNRKRKGSRVRGTLPVSLQAPSTYPTRSNFSNQAKKRDNDSGSRDPIHAAMCIGRISFVWVLRPWFFRVPIPIKNRAEPSILHFPFDDS